MDPRWEPKVVVVGVDGSEQSQHAAMVASSIARRNAAKLFIVTVVRPPEGWWGIVGSPPTPAALGHSLSDAQQQVLDAVVASVDLDGIDYDTVEEIGDPASRLIAVCREQNADVLVVGKRGAGLLERVVLGSVASRLAHETPCQLVIVP